MLMRQRQPRPPCTSPGKHPFGKLAPNGLRSATLEPGVIKHWWGYIAPEANLGVTTNRLIVIDIDPRHGGDESLRAIEAEHGEIPPTWQVLTGGGGAHVIFGCPDGVEIHSVVAEQSNSPPLGRGIDIRATGGYIVAPPSRHISGRLYAWSVDHHPKDVALAPAPDWLIGRLSARTSDSGDVTPPEEWQRLTKKVPAYPDMAAAKVAGHLLRKWVNPYLVAGLLHAWNHTYVEPPIPDDELRRILDRVARLEDRRRDAQQEGADGAA
jgi:Bifunctional DNA primase/polymerase, N-terminal